jgi:hypothetical protein
VKLKNMDLRFKSYTSSHFTPFFKALSLIAIVAFGTLITILFIGLITESALLKTFSIISTTIVFIAFFWLLIIKKSSRRLVEEGSILFGEDGIEIHSGGSFNQIHINEIVSLTVFKDSYDGETEANWALGGIVTLNGFGNSLSIVANNKKLRLYFYAESKAQLRSLAKILSNWNSNHKFKVRFTDKRSSDLLSTPIY